MKIIQLIIDDSEDFIKEIKGMLENGLDKCTCKKKSCERHGKCAECIDFHKTNKREPYCKRKKLLTDLFGNRGK